LTSKLPSNEEKGFKIKACGERLHFIWGRGQAQNG
jgi:hypothetical protein